MKDKELYRELGILTKNREQWEANIPYVSSLVSSDSIRIQAKVLWLLGEMGLAFPEVIKEHVPSIARFCDSPDPLVRSRAVNALGRIGRGNFKSIEPYWKDLFQSAKDDAAQVRLSFIWASENIAVNMPDPYAGYMHVYEELLNDPDDKVRMEAPELFRVIGSRRPEAVKPYIGILKERSETDPNRVIRIHCLGAIKAAEKSKQKAN